MCYLLTVILTVTIASAFAATPAVAQCNNCGQVGECFDFHWDNCGYGGGHNWSGDCSPGCDVQDCAAHSGGCLASLGFDKTVQLASTGDYTGLAKASMTGEIEFDVNRGVIYVRSCSSDQIIGQVPLPRRAALLVASAIESRRNVLLAVLDP